MKKSVTIRIRVSSDREYNPAKKYPPKARKIKGSSIKKESRIMIRVLGRKFIVVKQFYQPGPG